jgi:hypothetical protein
MPPGSELAATPDINTTSSSFAEQSLRLTDKQGDPVPSTYSLCDGHSNGIATAPAVCGYYAGEERSFGGLTDGYLTSLGVSGVYYIGCWSHVRATPSMTMTDQISANRTLGTFASSTGIGSSSLPGQGMIVSPPFMSDARSLGGISRLYRLMLFCGIYSTLFLL